MGQYDEYVVSWKKRIEEEQAALRTRMAGAGKAARECARILGEKYGALRVYLVGSLVRKELFGERSDIDLVVEGLSARSYFPALKVLWSKLPEGMELDLIPYEDAFEEMKKHVQQEGVILYEKPTDPSSEN